MNEEYGRTGAKRWQGRYREEFERDLQGIRGVHTYQEMSENDDVVGAILFAIKMLIRQADWTVRAGGLEQRDSEAAEFVEMIQTRQGIAISAPEEIAFINGFINRDKLLESAKAYGKSPYGEHLKAVAEGKIKY